LELVEGEYGETEPQQPNPQAITPRVEKFYHNVDEPFAQEVLIVGVV